MLTYTVWLDRLGKWHCFEEGWGVHGLTDKLCRQTAQLLVGQRIGTNDLCGSAIVAYCIHASTRNRAIRSAQEAYKSTLLVEAQNG